MREPANDSVRLQHILDACNDYYRISPEKLWDTIQNDIPELKAYLERLLVEM